jgi:hypothetical protein
MIFSTKQMQLTYSFMTNSDETTLKSLIAGIQTSRLKTIYKTIERSLINREYLHENRCEICNLHFINVEEGISICDTCLAE